MPIDPEKLAKLQAATRTGGKGMPRRKQRPAPVIVAQEDPKLKSHLQRLNVQDLPTIEEVNMFDETGVDRIMNFKKPKVQANPNANVYVVTGRPQEKTMTELLPDIIYSLGPKQFEQIKAVAEQAGIKTSESAEAPSLETENFEQFAEEQQQQEQAAESQE
ncbi:hypothetical protein RCL1_006530 [Eukaryota sp. TZLM3-RCL]